MASAPFLASGDLKRSVIEVPAEPVRTALTPLMLTPRPMSVTVLNIWPLPVLRAVIGRTVPALVLTTGSTTATVLVTGLTIWLVTIAVLVTNVAFDTANGVLTTTVVVKLWQMKNPGNQKPNQNTGNGTQA